MRARGLGVSSFLSAYRDAVRGHTLLAGKCTPIHEGVL